MTKNRWRSVLVTVLAVLGSLLLPLLHAQYAYAEVKKFSGSAQIMPALSETTMLPGDDANHAVRLVRVVHVHKESSIGEFQASGVLVTDYVAGSGIHRGYSVHTLPDGDKRFVAFEGTTKAVPKADGPPTTTFEGKSRFTGGTGKWKTLTGSFAYKGGTTPTGVTYQYEGEYEVK